MKALKFVPIKAIGHTEELQVTTFCDNWENVETRATMYVPTRQTCVVKSNLLQ